MANWRRFRDAKDILELPAFASGIGLAVLTLVVLADEYFARRQAES